MGIYRKTDENVHAAAALNGRLREAMKRRAEHTASGNGSLAGARPDAPDSPESARLWFLDTPAGPALAGRAEGAGGSDGLCLLAFPPDKTLRETDALCDYLSRLERRLGLSVSCGDAADPLAARLERELAEWFAGERRRFDIPLVLRGTPFQRSVWEALRAIPYGAMQSYGKLADSLGKPEAARAVGAANGRNPISIVVPCHRVVGANGSLTGYAGGLERKRFLLALEQGRAPEAREQGQAELFGFG